MDTWLKLMLYSLSTWDSRVHSHGEPVTTWIRSMTSPSIGDGQKRERRQGAGKWMSRLENIPDCGENLVHELKGELAPAILNTSIAEALKLIADRRSETILGTPRFAVTYTRTK